MNLFIVFFHCFWIVQFILRRFTTKIFDIVLKVCEESSRRESLKMRMSASGFRIFHKYIQNVATNLSGRNISIFLPDKTMGNSNAAIIKKNEIIDPTKLPERFTWCQMTSIQTP